MEKVKQDYRWMTKVAIHLVDTVEEFIEQYQIPKEDIVTVKKLWKDAIQDWKSFEHFANTPNKKTKKVAVKCTNRKIQPNKIETPQKEVENAKCESKVVRCRNAKILNRVNQFNFQQEEEEDLINKYIDELNYQKAKKLSDLISFYEEEELNITPSFSIA